MPWTNRYFIDILYLIDKILFLYSRKGANSNRTAEYFKPLGKKRVERLFRIYQIDFEMFGYSYEIYASS